MSPVTRDLENLTTILRRATQTGLHAWRPLMVIAGTALSDNPPGGDDLLGFLVEQPLQLRDRQEGLRAIELTERLQQAVAQRLLNGNPVLALAPTPKSSQGFAAALGEALLGLADGLDTAGVDPDAFPPAAAEAFEALGQRSAVILELADMLDDGEDVPGAGDELQAAVRETEADLRTLWRELRGGGRPVQ